MQLKTISLGAIASLALTACASSVEQVEVMQAFEVSDPTIVKPVAITKVVAKMRRGSVVGTAQAGIACLGAGKIYWQSGGTINLSSEELVDVFRNELEANGWPVAGSTDDLFSNYDVSGAELLIGAKISDIKANICTPMSGFYDFDKKGSLRMDVDWQFFDPARRQIIGELSTSGSHVLDQSMPTGDYELLATAFSVAVNNLLASEEFRQIVSRQEEMISPNPTSRTALDNDFNRFSSIREATEYAQRSTVTIRTANGTGSGFAIGDGSLVLSNAHVVGEAANVTLVTGEGLEIPATVEQVDKGRDVALLRVQSVRLPALHLKLTDSELTSQVFAVGSPFGEALAGTVTSGIISSYRDYEGYRWLQSDASVNKGNSGGPLIDASGSVVGITTVGLTETGGNSGLNLFVPTEDAISFLGLDLGETSSLPDKSAG